MKYLIITLYLLAARTIISYAQTLPVKPVRTISFITDEGTNMDLDISPDGKTLVFDLLGDLYTVPVSGGNAIQLTRGIALNLRPVWSPDKKKIAYISDYTGAFHINVLDTDGQKRIVLGKSDGQLNYSPDLSWSPDGHAIGGFNNYLYGLDGSKFTLPFKTSHLLRFALAGNLIYYANYDPTQKLYKLKLYRYDKALKSSSDIAAISKRFLSNIAVSPDARWLAFVLDTNSQKALVVEDIQTTARRILIPALFKNDPQDNLEFQSHFAFSPDSKDIYIAYQGKIHRIGVQSGNDQVIPFTAHVNADLGPFDYHTYRVTHDPLIVKYSRSASTSPDGKRLVFSALDKIYIMDLPNGKPRMLAPQAISQFQPAWSSDGKWVAYVSWCDTAGGQLWRAPVTGGRPEQLTKLSGQYQRPAWSPDGKLIAVIKGAPILGDRDDTGAGQLELVPINGGTVHSIADSIPLWNDLAFSADGHRLIYAPRQDRKSKVPLQPQLVSETLNVDSLRVIAAGSGITFYQQKMVSPDGRYIAYSADENVYLVPVSKPDSPTILSDEDGNLRGVRFAAGVDPVWEQGGKILNWTYGNHFYRIRPEEIVDTNQVKPDQIVTLNLTVPANYSHGIIALTNARIITMQGDKVIKHGTIIIKDGRFVMTGKSSEVSISKGAQVIDLKGKTIMPGIVDLHLHMRVPPDVFPQQSWMYLINLAYGVTTARDPSSNFDSFGYAELLQSGQMLGPRLFTVGRAVRLRDGVVKFDGPDDARAVVEKRALFGGTEIKQYLLPTRIQREWLLQASNAAALNVTNEGGNAGLLAMIKDGSTGVEHNPSWTDAYNDVVTFFAKSGTWFTPTLQVTPHPGAKQYFNHVYWHGDQSKLARFMPENGDMNADLNGAESYGWITKGEPKDTTTAGFLYSSQVDARIRKAGGKVTLGSHGNDEGIGVHNELWALQMGGLTNMQALQAATIMGAQALGIQKDVGSIEVGKIADLIILNKNPLDDIHNSRDIKYVMKDGILYDGDTLDEIWPVKKKCPEWRLKNAIDYEQSKEPQKKLTGGVAGDDDND